MLIDGVSAILLISPDAEALARFYREALALPLEDEVRGSYGAVVAPEASTALIRSVE